MCDSGVWLASLQVLWFGQKPHWPEVFSPEPRLCICVCQWCFQSCHRPARTWVMLSGQPVLGVHHELLHGQCFQYSEKLRFMWEGCDQPELSDPAIKSHQLRLLTQQRVTQFSDHFQSLSKSLPGQAAFPSSFVSADAINPVTLWAVVGTGGGPNAKSQMRASTLHLNGWHLLWSASNYLSLPGSKPGTVRCTASQKAWTSLSEY